MEPILIGTTDRSIFVWIADPASTTGAGKTGLAAAAVTVTYSRMETDNDAIHTDVTSSVNDLSALTDAHNDWGWKEVSSTLSKGLYRLDVADAVFATGAWYAVVQVTITSGTAAATPKAFRLVAYNELDGVRLGLTSLPNAAAEASGGLATLSAAQASNGTINVNVHRWLTGTPLALSSQQVQAIVPDSQKVDVNTIKTQAVTCAAPVTVLASVGTAATSTAQTGDSYAIVSSGTHGNAALKTLIDAVDDFVDTEVAAIKTVVDAIKAKTDNLPSDPADASDVAAAFSTVNSTLSTIAGYIDTEVASLVTAVAAIPTANQNAAALLDYSDAIETGITPRLALRYIGATTVGKSSGAGTGTEVFKGIGVTTTRVTATISSNNRTAVTLA